MKISMIEPAELIAQLLLEHGWKPYSGASFVEAEEDMKINQMVFEKNYGTKPLIYHRWRDARVIMFGVARSDILFHIKGGTIVVMQLCQFNFFSSININYFNLVEPDSINDLLKWANNQPLPEKLREYRTPP